MYCRDSAPLTPSTSATMVWGWGALGAGFAARRALFPVMVLGTAFSAAGWFGCGMPFCSPPGQRSLLLPAWSARPAGASRWRLACRSSSCRCPRSRMPAPDEMATFPSRQWPAPLRALGRCCRRPGRRHRRRHWTYQVGWGTFVGRRYDTSSWWVQAQPRRLPCAVAPSSTEAAREQGRVASVSRGV